MQIDPQNFLIDCLQYCGVPYVWGGASIISGVDCSGYVQIVLEKYGLDPKGDQTAQALYDHFLNTKTGVPILKPYIELGNLLFFGSSIKNITHVAIAVSTYRMVEAGGGGRNTTSIEIARRQGAKVRVSNINSRKDYIGGLQLTGLNFSI